MEYKKLDAFDIEYLISLLGREKVLVGEEISEDFSHDELGGISRRPDVLAEVTSAAEVSEIMKYACEKTIPVVARGSGTGLVCGSVPVFGGIMINLSKMD